MAFSQSTINDLDVVSLVELSALVKNFVENNRIVARDLIMVLGSDTYFEKELVGKDDKEMAEDVQTFVDSVPLVNPSSKIFKVGEKYRVVVINRRLYESLRTAFESVRFGVIAVVPELILGTVGVTGSEFDLNACRLILKSSDYIMNNSFIGPVQVKENDNWVNQNKKKALILAILGIAIAVIGIGVVVWQTVSTRNAGIARAKARQKMMAVVEPTPTPTPTPAVASSSARLADYTVNVLNGTGIAGEANRVAELLKKKGFSKITTGNYARSYKTLVVLAVRVPQEVRNIFTEVLSQATLIENTQTQFDVQITLGRITP